MTFSDGTFTVGVYSLHSGELQFMTEGHTGVTHLAFSADGNYLYSGGRKVGDARMITLWNVSVVYVGSLHCVLGYEEPREGTNENKEKCTDQSKNVF